MLTDDRGEQLGTCVVTEQVRVIKHDDAIFVRTDRGVRVGHKATGAIAVVFEYVEPFIRGKLEKA